MFKVKIFVFVACLSLTKIAGAYTIGGAYAQLIDCSWGKYGYEYGHIGTYKVNGEIYRIFFGSSYCEY